MLRANNMSHRKMPQSSLQAAMSSPTSPACMQNASLSDQLRTAHAKRTVTTAGASGSTAGADGGSSVRLVHAQAVARADREALKRKEAELNGRVEENARLQQEVEEKEEEAANLREKVLLLEVRDRNRASIEAIYAKMVALGIMDQEEGSGDESGPGTEEDAAGASGSLSAVPSEAPTGEPNEASG